MAFGFDSTLGYVPPTYEQLLDRVAELYEAETGVIVDLEQDSPTLRLMRALARIFKAAYDDQAGTYAAGSILTAAGASLRNLLLPLIGPPLADLASTVVLPLAGSGTTGAGSTVVLDSDGAGAIPWVLTADVLLPGNGLFRYSVPGPKSAPAGSTWSIASSDNLNWSGAGPNVADASKGRLAETDSEYRQRLRLSIQGLLIAVSVLQVPGVTSVNIFENPTDVPDSYWGETHWVEVLVQGGDDAAIAAAIQRARANTVQTLGTTSVATPEPNYQDGLVTIRFSRPNEVDVWVSLTITKGEGYSADTSAAAVAARELALRNQILAWAALRRVGLDATAFQVAAIAAQTPGVPGIANIASTIGTVNPPVSTSVVAGVRDLLVFDAARILLFGV